MLYLGQPLKSTLEIIQWNSMKMMWGICLTKTESLLLQSVLIKMGRKCKYVMLFIIYFILSYTSLYRGWAKKVHRAKFLNRHSSKSIWVIKLSFNQNDCPWGGSFWSKDSLITHILFELCLFRNLAQCTLFLLTLYNTLFYPEFCTLKYTFYQEIFRDTLE